VRYSDREVKSTCNNHVLPKVKKDGSYTSRRLSQCSLRSCQFLS
jgi:hypothetical protein